MQSFFFFLIQKIKNQFSSTNFFSPSVSAAAGLEPMTFLQWGNLLYLCSIAFAFKNQQLEGAPNLNEVLAKEY